MEKESTHTTRSLNMKAIMLMTKNVDLVFYLIVMILLLIREIGKMAYLMERAFPTIWMEERLKLSLLRDLTKRP
jgi:hypothetical protein